MVSTAADIVKMIMTTIQAIEGLRRSSNSFIVYFHLFYGWLARWLTVLTLLRRSRGRKSSLPRISTQFFDLGAGAVK